MVNRFSFINRVHNIHLFKRGESDKDSPIRLEKQSEKISVTDKVCEYAIKYSHILLPILYFFSILLFIWLCYRICGISAVESGRWYRGL